MKKYFKYFLYGLIYLILIFVFAIMFIVTAPADVIKPNNGIEPYQVVKIQLRSLRNNDEPFKNAGIEQTWEFAHPNNKKFTGPLEKFKTMLSSDSYKMLLNHIDHRQGLIHNNLFWNSFFKNIVNNKRGNHNYDEIN